MKYVDEFRDRRLIERTALKIRQSVDRSSAYDIMEVCGTHTMNIFRFGLKELLPANIRLISGPGCPVCVTPNEYLDKAIAIANMRNVIITTFGDMMRVPASRSSLEKEKAKSCDIRTVYSTTDAMDIARRNPEKETVFLGIGFETTAPTVAQSLIIAKRKRLNNYSVLCGHKTMPEALEALVQDNSIRVGGFLLPGHVSAIIGQRPYEFLSEKYKKKCVISGFEPLDIMQSILMVIKQNPPKIQIQYKRIIEKNGNRLARESMNKVFEKSDSVWRGIGHVAGSGLKISKAYKDFNAEARFKPRIEKPKDNIGCFCGYILKGIKTPPDCPSFARRCTPENPAGSCMVSSEGTCAAYYKYSRSEPLS